MVCESNDTYPFLALFLITLILHVCMYVESTMGIFICQKGRKSETGFEPNHPKDAMAHTMEVPALGLLATSGPYAMLNKCAALRQQQIMTSSCM
jgi:hypothetical protein